MWIAEISIVVNDGEIQSRLTEKRVGKVGLFCRIASVVKG